MITHNEDIPLDITSPKSDSSHEGCRNHALCTPIKYTGLVPITPMPQYNNLDTPELYKHAKKYGIKQGLGKTRLQTKLKEVYLYNHQLASPAAQTPTKDKNYSLLDSGAILHASDADTIRCMPLESPKSRNCGLALKSKQTHRALKHRPKDIGLIASDTEDTQKTASTKTDVRTVPDWQSRLSTLENELLETDTGINIVTDNSSAIGSSQKNFDDATESVCHGCDSISDMPVISLLDSSSDTSFGNASIDQDEPMMEVCSNDFGISPSKDNTGTTSKIQSSNRSHDFIDLTANDLSCSALEYSVQDIFEVPIVGTTKILDHVDNPDCKNISTISIIKQDAEVFNFNDDAAVCSDKSSESGEEDFKMYDEREKFHQSLFGSTHENSTDEEESDEECMSLFQRIMKKKMASNTTPSVVTSELIGVSKSQSSTIRDNNKNQITDTNTNSGMQAAEFSPPQKIRKKATKVSYDTEAASYANSQSKSKNSTLAKEYLELEMCRAIKANSELHSHILLYRPIYFSRFKMVMKDCGVQVSSNALRDFLDSKGITFSTADENRHKGTRVARKRGKAK